MAHAAPKRDIVNSSGPVKPPLPAVDDPQSAELARALLTQHDPGISRLCFVAVPERVGVHLLLAAREQGLDSRVSRGARGQLTIVLEAPPAPSAASLRPGRRQPVLLAHCQRMLRRVAGCR